MRSNARLLALGHLLLSVVVIQILGRVDLIKLVPFHLLVRIAE